MSGKAKARSGSGPVHLVDPPFRGALCGEPDPMPYVAGAWAAPHVAGRGMQCCLACLHEWVRS